MVLEHPPPPSRSRQTSSACSSAAQSTSPLNNNKIRESRGISCEGDMPLPTVDGSGIITSWLDTPLLLPLLGPCGVVAVFSATE
ncbi:hypothetical protein TCDM_11169 [Trypanosoma cruzi Dm28c]|uniref:Uncharacterized protein n=1 Tax=Trypanosoma cruzi Dm28c TaxID=1416333 RepID=V5B5J4_TRYCR|nr:hypothetical protein TCDM_11169 [Trypanosoma cruzi Dm28c]